MSDSVQPHRWQPTRLRRPWDSPGKNTGVGCHFLLQCMKVKVKSESEVGHSKCPTLRDPMDYSLPGSSVHGIFQARVLEWVAIAFSVIIISFIQKVNSSAKAFMMTILSVKVRTGAGGRAWYVGAKRKFSSLHLNINCFAYHSGGPGTRQTDLHSNPSSATGDSGQLQKPLWTQFPHLSNGHSNSTHLKILRYCDV